MFRASAVERLSAPEQLDQGLTVVNDMSWALLGALAALIAGALVWSVILKIPVTVAGEGILLSPGGVLDVSSGSQGRLVKFLIRPGDHVTSGQTVAQLDQPELRSESAIADSDVRDIESERAQVVAFQKRRFDVASVSIKQRREALNDNIAFLNRNLGWNIENARIENDLASKGIGVREKALQAQIAVGDIQDELSKRNTALKDIDDEDVKARVADEQTMLDIDIKLGAARRKAAAIDERLTYETSVTSPYSGRVEEVKVNIGELVERGTALFALVPDDVLAAAPTIASAPGTREVSRLTAVVYVPASSGKQVVLGAPVDLALSTARQEEYGFVEGQVRSVAVIPSTAEGMQRTLKNRQLVQLLSNNGAPFEVVVDLFVDRNTPSGLRWSSSHGPNITVNDGTLVTAEIQTRSLPVLGLLVPPLREWIRWLTGPADPVGKHP